jgi:hypothetical protein
MMSTDSTRRWYTDDVVDLTTVQELRCAVEC